MAENEVSQSGYVIPSSYRGVKRRVGAQKFGKGRCGGGKIARPWGYIPRLKVFKPKKKKKLRDLRPRRRQVPIKRARWQGEGEKDRGSSPGWRKTHVGGPKQGDRILKRGNPWGVRNVWYIKAALFEGGWFRKEKKKTWDLKRKKERRENEFRQRLSNRGGGGAGGGKPFWESQRMKTPLAPEKRQGCVREKETMKKNFHCPRREPQKS